jgi:hypothetical protein
MALRHVVFAECAQLIGDPYLQDVFLGMAYSMYPMCVAEEERDGTAVLLFRPRQPKPSPASPRFRLSGPSGVPWRAPRRTRRFA